MIRTLMESDRSPLTTLLETAPAHNLYLLGNLETPGFSADFCRFWGDFADDGNLRGVINRYMTGWSVFGRPDADWAGLMALLDQDDQATRLQDNPGGIESVTGFLRRRKIAATHDEELMALNPADFRPSPPPNGVLVRQATLADLSELVPFYADAGDMSRAPEAVERPLRAGRVWAAVEQGRIVAAALVNAETSRAAMIGGVYTLPNARGRGLSSAVCSALCARLLAHGKQPTLYWKNPAAGAVYGKLGFCAQGRWRSIWLAKVGSRKTAKPAGAAQTNRRPRLFTWFPSLKRGCGQASLGSRRRSSSVHRAGQRAPGSSGI